MKMIDSKLKLTLVIDSLVSSKELKSREFQ